MNQSGPARPNRAVFSQLTSQKSKKDRKISGYTHYSILRLINFSKQLIKLSDYEVYSIRRNFRHIWENLTCVYIVEGIMVKNRPNIYIADKNVKFCRDVRFGFLSRKNMFSNFYHNLNIIKKLFGPNQWTDSDKILMYQKIE